MNTELVRDGDIELRIRAAVALRARPVANGILYYLSLYDREIDARAEEFLRHFPSLGGANNWRDLELTDAVVLRNLSGGVWVARGAAATFSLYWSARAPGLVVSTALPVAAGEPFSAHGLLAAVAGSCVHSSYEPNGFTETPLACWRRVRRGATLHFERGRVADEHPIEPITPRQDTPVRTVVARHVRDALDAYAHSQLGVGASLVEVSGGYDSTLAVAGLQRDAIHGVSVVFPYYEFRYEAALEEATATALGIDRIELDGTDMLPFTPADQPAPFDEPSVFVTGIRHAEHVGRYANSMAAQQIYMGHGGDQCFATDLTVDETLVLNPASRQPFSPKAWRSVHYAIEAMERTRWRQRRLGTFVYDAAQDVWVKEAFGATVRTPFSDLAVFRAAYEWSALCGASGKQPDKTILVEAASDLLPAAVVQRRGKVAYNGVWMRAQRNQAAYLSEMFEQVRSVFGHLGVSTDWLQRRVADLGEWRDRSDREVMALYAIAYWLAAWQITRQADVDWADPSR